MRTVVVELLTHFDFALSSTRGEPTEGHKVMSELWDGKTEYEKDLRDSYVMTKGNLWVQVRRREKVEIPQSFA